MTLPAPTSRTRWAGRRQRAALLGCLAAAAGWLAFAPVAAQTRPTPASPAVAADGTGWNELSPQQQAALRPLQREWAGIDGLRRQKWIGIASRFASMSPAEKERLQERMNAWVRLSPQERRTARLNYHDAQDVPPQERRDRWAAYQALSDEERRELARRAAAAQAARSNAKKGTPVAAGAQAKSPPATAAGAVPAQAGPAAQLSPVLRQARPGATTTSISKRPAPPGHQHAGMPKIVATPELVDTQTLLPRVPPQGTAASTDAAASRRK
ncbi:DUF3106 domain-containing protein [Eleftheria terrae]|uniref:DUF3106 domain-containing protein n=1 Tax=Eleftheria terrae TaxID=1597781 RepID=UPI00263B1E57|nr:DUF3106 domain-containing protein [Eleftheria terrae]WKB52736.1 DUF3106 domain-containing protein [Eleftheria terrae]